jgi:hypothetical protein
MYLVAARGQFEAKLRRNDAAAAVSGIAGDADPHADVILPENRLWGRLLTCAPIANRRKLRG